jgi:predicted dehydrogenase
MARTYGNGLTKMNKRAKLVAVNGGKRGPGLAADLHVDYEPSYEKLLARPDVDAVLLATPHAAHIEEAVQAARHGKHILTEKPMATSVAECDRMIEEAKKANVYLEVIRTLRFRGTPSRAKKLIDEGAIGQVRMIRGQSLFTSYVDTTAAGAWILDPREGGAFLDMGVHNFDVLRFFAGSEVKRIYSNVLTFTPGYPIPDLTALTQLSMANGVICQMWMCHELPAPGMPDSRHRYVIVGDKGTLDVDGYGKLQLGRGDKWETVWTQAPFDPDRDPASPIRLEAFSGQVEAFAEDVLMHRPATAPGEDGRTAVELVEAARLSSRTGRAIDLPLKR